MSRAEMMSALNLTPADFGEKDLQAQYTELVQKLMDDTVKTRGYDDVFTCISYVNSTDETFRAEANSVLAWRDRVWRKCYTMLAEIEAGQREIPTQEELLAELPTLEW